MSTEALPPSASAADVTGSFRERQRAALLREATAVAIRRFVESGFEGTSMDQISAEVGVSTRMLFRLVGSKSGFIQIQGAQWRTILHEHFEPAPEDTCVTDTYERAFQALLTHIAHNRSDTVGFLRMLAAEPALRAQFWHYAGGSDWLDLEIASRLSTVPGAPSVRLFRTLLRETVDFALLEWAAEPRHDASSIVHNLLEVIRAVEEQLKNAVIE